MIYGLEYISGSKTDGVWTMRVSVIDRETNKKLKDITVQGATASEIEDAVLAKVEKIKNEMAAQDAMVITIRTRLAALEMEINK